MQIRHDFEDADTGEEVKLEVGVVYAITGSFVELGMPEDLVFTHRVREAIGPLSLDTVNPDPEL